MIFSGGDNSLLRFILKSLGKSKILGKKITYEHGLEVLRPQYATPLFWQAEAASKLGIRAISTIEFGVAGGEGLLALEAHAEVVSALTGVEIRCWGFDFGSGLPDPEDWRDVSYKWQRGDFVMDLNRLQQSLGPNSRLVLGNAAETFRKELDEGGFSGAPIAFLAVDLDYYSSTFELLKVFSTAHPSHFLPRVQAYFDDIGGIAEFQGERAAIIDFQALKSGVHLGQQKFLRERLVTHPRWADQMFEFHFPKHHMYALNVEESKQMPLKAPNSLSKRPQN